MPKKIPITEKREWLALYEEGRSEASIARDKQRDLNVIKRGIQEAKNERNLAAAQSQMLATALRQHQDRLILTLRNILDTLVVPDVEVELPRRVSVASPVKLTNARVEYDSQKGLFVTIRDEGSVHWQLLREHLRSDRLWAKLEQWKQAMVTYIGARIGLRLKASGLLEDGTGLRVLTTPMTGASGNDCLYEGLVTLFYHMALEEALEVPGRLGLREDMIVVSEPYVRYGQGNAPLAQCSKLAAECRSNIITAYRKLMKADQIGTTRKAHEQLVEGMDKARALAEEIVLLGLIPGQCRVCRRLGM